MNGNNPCQLQIMEFFLKPLTHLAEIVVSLGVLLCTCRLSAGFQVRQLTGSELFQPPLSRQNVHGQFFIVLQIQLIHLVQHGDVFHQRQLVLLQLAGNLVHIGLDLGILCLHCLQPVSSLFKEAQNSLFLLLVSKAPQLHHQLGESLSHLAQVLGADRGKRGL